MLCGNGSIVCSMERGEEAET